MNIGILALQGDFFMHGQAVKKLGYTALYVRKAQELNNCDLLIIPGGESTTFLRLIEKLNMRSALVAFGKQKGIMGTCAGLITLASQVEGLPLPPLALIDIKAKRNAYGRQIDSFADSLRLEINGQSSTFEGVFIRAPKIFALGKDVKALAFHNNDVVMASNAHILVTAFHPELTADSRIHEFFIQNYR